MMRAALCWTMLLIALPIAARAQGGDTTPSVARDDQEPQAVETAASKLEAMPAGQPPNDDAKPLRFRRVYVPEQDLLERVKPSQRYVPMDAGEFDARLQRMRTANPASDEPLARIVYARYTASLDRALRLSGKGAWHVKLTGKHPLPLPLSGLRFALRQPRWTTEGGSSAVNAAAKLGATQHGVPALYADRSGTVEFDWSLAGSRDAQNGLTYELSFPPAPASQVELALPADLIPSVDGAMITGPYGEGEAVQRWTIDPVGQPTAQLRLAKHSAHKPAQPAVVYKPKLTYQISSKGLELSGECRLDVYGAPLRRLELALDPGLTLLSAKAGDIDLSWSIAPDAADKDLQPVVLEFPEPLEGTNRLLRLVAVGPLISEPGWKLPLINPRDVIWQDGAIALVVATPLSLKRLDLDDCRQTKRETLPPPAAAGEAIGIQAFAPSAAVTVHIAAPLERLELTSATTLEMDGNEAVGSYVAEITAPQSQRFQLFANISPDWIIDSVQSSPADMIADWELQAGEGTASRLIVHLARTLARDRPLRLNVRATRRRAPLGDTLKLKDLDLLVFDNVTPRRRLVMLKSAAAYRLDVRGVHHLSRLDPARLDPLDRNLLGEAPQGLLFVIDEAARDLEISLSPEQPRFSASLETRAVVGEHDLAESYQLHISPESNELERVLVYFSHAGSGELAWTVEDGDLQQIAARRLSPSEHAAQQGRDNTGETWEVTLKPARTTPFVLKTKRASPIQDDMPVSLPSLLDATSQQGSLLVELAADFIPALQPRRLKPQAVEPAAPGEYQNVLAAYQYDPTEDLLVAKQAALTLKIDREAAHQRSAWVWRCMLEAWFSASRLVHHRASFFIENQGRSFVSITVPSAVLPSLKVDGTASDAATWNRMTGKLDVPLPAGRRFCLVEVVWDGGEASLRGISSPALEWPACDVPILSRHAAVWLPSGYSLADTAEGWHAAPTRRTSWRERLFGPLGRSDDRSIEAPPGVAAQNDLLWPAAGQRQADDMPTEGWVAYSLEWPTDESPLRLLIVRRQTMLALSVGLFIASAGVAVRLGGRRPVYPVIGLGLVVMVALSLPATFSSLGAATVLGFISGRAWAWLSLRAVAARQVEVGAEHVAAVASSVIIVFGLLWVSSVAAQQRPKGQGQRVSAEIYDVLIPIDEKENVAGDKVYVPEALYAELMAATSNKPKEHDYLITSAEYEGQGKPLETGDRFPAPQTWKATLTVEPLQSPTRVFLPLGSDGAHIVPESGRLNGEPLRFGWDEARRSITFDVKSPGTAKVEFAFRPKRRDDSSSRGVSFSVPNVPQSRLQLSTTSRPAFQGRPESSTALEGRRTENWPSISALGGIYTDDDSKQLVAELGPLGEVSVTWSAPAPPRDSARQFDSEELTWLKLRPGSALLNARFSVQVRRGELKDVLVKLDEHLLPLPPPKDSPIESIQRVSETELRLRFAQPLTERAVLDLAFVLDTAGGTGRFMWPHVELVGSQASRRYIACTVDPSLDLVSPPPAQSKPLNAAQFATLWGEAEARPLAFELPPATPRWELDIRPRQTKLTSNYRSVVQADVDQAELQWDAAVDISGGSRFQLRAAVPPDLTIDRVEVRDAAGVRPSRWEVSDERTLSVFLEAAATGNLNISLRGRLPAGADRRVSVPLLEVEGSAGAQASVLILRRSNVLASIDQHAELREFGSDQANALLSAFTQSAAAEHAADRPRLVAAFDAKLTRGPITLALQPNRPRVEAEQAVSLSRPNDSWQAALDLKLNVVEGVLDVVRIEAPASWDEPIRIDPAMPFELVEVPGETRRQLLLFPPQPMTGAAQLRVEGRLSPTVGGRIRAPDVRLAGAATLRQYFILPLQQELQTLAWETSGLKPDAIPHGLIRSAARPDTVQTVSPAADQFRALLRSVEQIADDFQVRLADIAVSWTSDRSCYGVASFDVEPAGRTSCRLALPAGYRLIHLSADGCPLQLTPAGDQRWQVPLSGGRLPQRIEVVFTGQWSAAMFTPKILEAPRLIGLPVERTLWTVSGPRWAGDALAANADGATWLRLQTARYQTVAGLIDSAANTLAEVASEETPRWYTAWAGRMIALRSSLARWQSVGQAADLDSESSRNAELVEQNQMRLAERLGMEDMLMQLATAPPRDESAVAVWHASLDRPHGSLGAMFLGEAPAMELEYSSPHPSDLPSRVIHVLVAAALLLAVVALLRSTAIYEWLQRRPRLVGIGAGLFWWLFLWPSALGWLIVTLCIVAPYLRSFAPRRWPRFGRLRRA